MAASAKQVAQLRAELQNIRKDHVKLAADLAKTNKILFELISHLKLGGNNEDKPVTNPSSPESSGLQSQEAGSDASSSGDGKQGVLDFAGSGSNQDGTGESKE